jgi:hypothetical protein
MKWFREPSGKFVIKIPTEWRYANVAVDYEEKSPFSFQSYENPNWSFQVSCYSDEEKSFNQRVTKQKFNTPKLEFKEFRMDGDGFNIHIWGATVENNTLMAKYIYDTGKESDTDILIELGRVKEALSTIQLLSPDKRTICFELDKYEKFMAALVASFDLKNNALKNESFIEFSIIVANQIDAYLRLSIVMREQLNESTDNIKLKYLYQSPTDKPVMERKIYIEAKSKGILNDEIFKDLEELYIERNKMVHRYIISEFRTKQLFEIAYRYETVCEKVRLQMRNIEDEQFERKIGIYGNGQHPHAEPTDEVLKLLQTQVNDKHLLKKFERKIKINEKEKNIESK